MRHNAGWYRQGDYITLDGRAYRIRYKEVVGYRETLTVTMTLRDWETGAESVREFGYFDPVEDSDK